MQKTILQPFTTLQLLIAKRIGVEEKDLIPVQFAEFSKQYIEVEISELFYKQYYQYQLSIFKKYNEQLIIINKEGITISELKQNPELYMYFNVEIDRMMSKYGIENFAHLLRDEYRKANNYATSMQYYEGLQKQYYQEFLMHILQFKELSEQQFDTRRQLQKFIKQNNDEVKVAEKLYKSLMSNQTKANDLRNLQILSKIEKFREKEKHIQTKMQNMEQEMWNTVEQFETRQEIKHLIQLKLNELFNKTITYKNPITNKYYNKDNKVKEQIQQQREQTGKNIVQCRSSGIYDIENEMMINIQMEREKQSKLKIQSRNEKMQLQLTQSFTIKKDRIQKCSQMIQKEAQDLQNSKCIYMNQEIQKSMMLQEEEKKKRNIQFEKRNTEFLKQKERELKLQLTKSQTSHVGKRTQLFKIENRFKDIELDQLKGSQLMQKAKELKSLNQQIQLCRPSSVGHSQIRQKIEELQLSLLNQNSE